MEELMNHLQQNCYDVVILSDANALFIEWFFCNRKLNVKKIYSNPAEFDEGGKLILHQFHHQTSCNQCPVNLCKGAVIKEHIESMRKAGTLYSTVCYTGDGENDFCPSLRLTENDYVFPRATFPLEQMLKSKMSEVKAQVVPWKSATVIKQKLQSLATQ
ncbi:hypothetical protein EB796_016774 [Bugula neritina]|uniref:PHOSPHO2 n=1 Tax=Bugula neritina TaxID=10212 RepID=A0A7J7JFW3_BUGNE|nr:hypothetical protein EB796_016774 [Bugula neritina]